MIACPINDDCAGALEREVEAHAELAKEAIRQYKRTIFSEQISAAKHLEQQRDVSRAVSRYIQLRRLLDEHNRASTTPGG